MEKKDLLELLETTKTTIETNITDKNKTEIATQLTESLKTINEQIEAVKKLAEKDNTAEVLALKEQVETTVKNYETLQRAFDLLQTRVKTSGNQPSQGGRKIKTLGELIGSAMQEVGVVAATKDSSGSGGKIEDALRSQGSSFALPLKSEGITIKDMTTAGSLTGDPVATYNTRQSIAPSQAINLRDLIPTVQSPTGLYVTYSENTGEVNNIAPQTEGSTKGQNDYALTEVKTVNSYIAGTAIFTKQLLRNLPWLQTTLPRMLLRDFFKVENSTFFGIISAAATGSTAIGTNPDDIIQLIAAIGNERQANYMPAAVLVSETLMARLLVSTYNKGFYAGAGAVKLTDAGMTIWNVPVMSATWVPAQKAFIFDADYIERVEVEGLNITFSFEDGNNFKQNKVTARIECFEQINPMRADSMIYADLGAS